MKYLCETCNYETLTKKCFDAHINSKKHLQKVHHVQTAPKSSQLLIKKNNEGNQDINFKLECGFCHAHFRKIYNLKRHEKTCINKINLEENIKNAYADKVRIYKQEINKLEDKINHLEELSQKDQFTINKLEDENKYLKSIINSAGNIIKTSVSTLSYVATNFQDAPPLAPIEDYSKITFDIDSDTEDKDIDKNKNEFIKLITFKYDKNILDKYLGDIIIKSYKKGDPKQQSIWSSDTSRLTYVVRELLHNKKIDWTVDKKGIKTKNYIITPLLEYINDLLRDYISENSITDPNKIDMQKYEPILNRMNKIANIIVSINNGTLAEGILSYITPDFYLNKSNNIAAIEK